MSEVYRQAGVDILAGYDAVERIKKHTSRTLRPEVLSGIGGFGALFQLDVSKYRNPVLVSGTDGVGTKLKIAFAMNRHDTIGIDAVAMCVNDILVQGAEPLFFLDYIACGRLKPYVIEEIVKGMAEGCVQAGCSLVGGETAEMPGFYADGEYDVAGFVVGVVEKEKMIDGSAIKPGDVVLGLASSGLHSNGFSLVRKVLLEQEKMDLQQNIDSLGKTLGEELLTPTRIYASILKVIHRYPVKGMAHITGGGFVENIPRILPYGLTAEIEYGSWPVPPVFRLIQEKGRIPLPEMFRIFNMGIGIVLVLPNEDKGEVDSLIADLESTGEKVYVLGRIAEGSSGVTIHGVEQA